MLVSEICEPFGWATESTIDHQATEQLKKDKPLGQWVGFEIYTDRNHLAFKEVAEFWQTRSSFTGFISSLNNLQFYRAMGFTLTYVIVVTPLVILFGLIIALAVNSLHRHLKGVMVVFSLHPVIVTPLGGSLILFWMMDGRVIGG